jgi:prepilin-type N-terminal cleavage/methylation domain-containing protein
MYKKAFTLLEILLTIVLIVVLMSIVMVAINPSRQIRDIRNSKRRADVMNIYTAINQYREANSGNLPLGIPSVNPSTSGDPNANAVSICQARCTESSTQIDISTELNPYLRFNTLPIDPLQTGTTLTGYKVYADSRNGRVVVTAPSAENSITINTIE